MFMFCVVTVLRERVLCCYGVRCICFVLFRWYRYMFWVVTVLRVHVLCCYGGTCKCFG